MSHRVLRVALAGLLATAVGCSNDPGTGEPGSGPVLTATSSIPAGPLCAAGGTRVTTGIDDDENGVLGADEIADTRDICFTTPLSSLVEVAAEAAGANCEHGGSAIRSGVDADGDRVLDRGEIDRVEYVCATAPDAAVVTRTASEAPGERCPSGGTVVESGPDVDGDGSLDDDEVTRSDVVCQDIPDVLVRVDAEPAGASCPAGGSVIRAGYDGDGDRVLDAGEVRTTSYVCDDAPTDVLVRIDAEAAGGTCPIGGHVVRSGRDVDGDGVLDASEVERTDRACFPGAQLTRVADEPAGPNCAHGGTVYLTGRDDNGDRVLDDSEVDARSYVCLADPAVHVGNARLQYDTDLRALEGKQRITGDLVIYRNGLTALPNLVEVGGEVRISDFNNASMTVRLPRLQRARTLNVSGEAVVEVSAPVFSAGMVAITYAYDLTRVEVGATERMYIYSCSRLTDLTLRGTTGGILSIYDNPLLATVAAPALQRVEELYARNLPRVVSLPWLATLTSLDRLYLQNLAALTSVELPLVATVEALALGSLPALTTLRAPALASARRLELRALPAAGTLELAPALDVDALVLAQVALLERVPTAIRVSSDGDVEIQGNGALRDLEGLTVGERVDVATVAANPALTGLGGLASIRAAGSLTVQSNPALAALSFPALATVGGSLVIEGNAALAALELPRLDNVGGAVDYTAFVVRQNPLHGLDLQALTYARSLTVTGLASGGLDLRRLAEVTGSLELADNPGLTAVDVATLAHVGDAVSVVRNRDLASLAVDRLETVGGALTVTDNAALGALDLDALTRVDGALAIRANGALAAIDIDRLAAVAGAVTVSAHAELTAIAAAALDSVGGDLRITDNPRFAQCRALALRAQLATLGGAAYVFGNDSTAGCL